MRNHADSEGVVRLYVYLLAPMIVEKLFVVETFSKTATCLENK
jgi:hypothetical protein